MQYYVCTRTLIYLTQTLVLTSYKKISRLFQSFGTITYCTMTATAAIIPG